MTGKALLRRLIVATSVPPIASLYRAIYRVLIRFAVWRLRQFGAVRAIYLHRGLACGDGIPGLSDIDLAVVGEWDRATESRVTEFWTRLARLCPLYDPTLGVYTPESLARLFAFDPFLRHRLAEGQRHWKLLFGEDCLSRLGALSEDQASAGYESEIRLWWTYFARRAFSIREDRSDRVLLNSLCYKVVAESLRMERGLRGLSVPESRRQAIAEALAESVGEQAAFLSRLVESARRRHLSYRGDIVEDVESFLPAFLEQCYRQLALRPGGGVKLRVDSPEQEHLHQREAIAGLVRGDAGPQWARISVVCGTAFAMDELVLFFEPSQGVPPNAAELRRLARVCAEKLGERRSRLSLYLRLPSVAVQFYAQDYFRGWQAILSPMCHPDMFSECEPGPWTAPGAAFIRQERLLLAQTLDDPVVYKANDLDFLRMVWKFLELVVAERSAAGGEAVLAQTPEAVLRGLRLIGAPDAPFLERLAAAYRGELAGARADIGRDIPRAIEYLKTIHHDLHA
jgi:predicted nucleotidyltransferase